MGIREVFSLQQAPLDAIIWAAFTAALACWGCATEEDGRETGFGGAVVDDDGGVFCFSLLCRFAFGSSLWLG